jgi:hypothetical protein
MAIKSFFFLSSEANDISAEDVRARLSIIDSLRMNVPQEVWGRIEYLQPQIGCFNLCSFCSQTAGSEIWQLTRKSLRNLFSALKTVLLEVAIKEQRVDGKAVDLTTGTLRADFRMPKNGLIAYGRSEHKPGVVFPYLDNDIFSYQYLYDYIKYMHDDLGARVRLTTVGYSRRNEMLNAMHEQIVRDLKPAIDGIRFSLTPYTRGWNKHSSAGNTVNREEYVEDLTNMLALYRPLIDEIGVGKDKACIEVRFPPLVYSSENDLRERQYKGRHILSSGPYLLVSCTEQTVPSNCHIQTLNGRTPVYSRSPVPYYMLISDTEIANADIMQLTNWLITTKPELPTDYMLPLAECGQTVARVVGLYQFENPDGSYYAVNPFFDSQDLFEGIHFYPRTTRRKNSGYINATRFFLNELVQFRNRRKATPVGKASRSTWENAAEVIRNLRLKADFTRRFDKLAAHHIVEEVVPLVEALKIVLQRAGYEADYFFNGKFVIDTGQIVNQGRANRHFGGLASTSDLPLTPHEERGYGSVSFNSLRSRVFRLAPVPSSNSGLITALKAGKRNSQCDNPGLELTELDGWLRRTDLPPFFVRGVEVERIKTKDLHRQYLIPGLNEIESIDSPTPEGPRTQKCED